MSYNYDSNSYSTDDDNIYYDYETGYYGTARAIALAKEFAREDREASIRYARNHADYPPEW